MTGWSRHFRYGPVTRDLPQETFSIGFRAWFVDELLHLRTALGLRGQRIRISFSARPHDTYCSVPE